jgi:hypothetical protein
MAAIDRRGGEAKILYAFRVILHDGKKDIGLFLEPNYESGDYFPGEKLAERRGEIGRFVSGHATEKRKKSAAEKARWMFSAERYRLMALKAALYAKALRDYGGDRTGYAEIADDLFAGLSRLGLVEKISKAKVFAVPNDGKARFVVRFKEDSGKKLERNIKKLEIFTGKLDLKDDFHKIRG